MNVYILSHQKSKHRLPKLIEQLHDYNCPVNPTIFYNDDVNFSLRDSIEYPMNYKMNDDYYIHMPEPLSVGEFACSIGHGKICELIVQNQDDYALVLEDDAILLRPNMFKEIFNLINEIKDFDVINLDARNTRLNHSRLWSTSQDGVRYKKHGCDNDTFYNPIPSNASLCYLLSKQGACKAAALRELRCFIPPDFLLWTHLDDVYITNEFFALDPILKSKDFNCSTIKHWSINKWVATMYDSKQLFCNGESQFSFTMNYNGK